MLDVYWGVVAEWACVGKCSIHVMGISEFGMT